MTAKNLESMMVENHDRAVAAHRAAKLRGDVDRVILMLDPRDRFCELLLAAMSTRALDPNVPVIASVTEAAARELGQHMTEAQRFHDALDFARLGTSFCVVAWSRGSWLIKGYRFVPDGERTCAPMVN